jgi:uncharacterized damage-inducible protein DinB
MKGFANPKTEFLMSNEDKLVSSIFDGWHQYQLNLIEALAPLSNDQLELRPATRLRSVGEIATHIIGARASWFYLLMGEGGEEFDDLGKWDRRGKRARIADELVSGLEATWEGMQAAITHWTAEDWERTWEGEGDDEPKSITRQWVIWHLIEHDLHHGGEISIVLGSHGVPALNL